MLKIVRKMGQLPFSALMGGYEEENLALGRRRWPREPESRQLALAEEDFRETVFFRQEGALYALWLREDRCVSALRLEPYRDGLLLEALATAPGERRKGYAGALIRAVQEMLLSRGPVRLYAHVAKRNTPSLRTHSACGFQKIKDRAVYIDGSADSRSGTLLFEAAKTLSNSGQ